MSEPRLDLRVCPHCCGSGALGIARPLVKLAEAIRAGSIPAAISTAYGNARTGRWPWLTRFGPNGRRDRHLWIRVADAAEWWLSHGKPSVAARLVMLATEGGGGAARR